MSGIFISYRRQDAAVSAGRLFDHLSRDLGGHRVFMDVEDIAPGLDFHEVLTAQVSACKVLLAVIGPGWVDIRDANGRQRLQQEDDYVRIEIVSALQRNIRVVPVLVDGASMPQAEDLPDPLKPLARRNAVELTHAKFSTDLSRLVNALQELVDTQLGETAPTEPRYAPGNAASGLSELLPEIAPQALGKFVFLAPEFPPKQLQTARLRCHCPPEEDIWCLMDLTVFRNANNALILTNTGMRYFNDGSIRGTNVEPLFWSYEALATAVFRKEAWPSISLNGTLINGGGGPDREVFLNLLLAVQKAVVAGKGNLERVRTFFQA